ncbi:MAG: alpha/beta fold hydrolase [Planctomycetota bacterium]
MHAVASSLLVISALASTAIGQRPELTGYWQGAAVRDGSVLPLSLQFDPADAVMRLDAPSLGIFGWITRLRPDSGPLRVPLARYELSLEVDLDHGVLQGDVAPRGGGEAIAAVQLLRVARPPIPNEVREEIQIESADGVSLGATVILPRTEGPHPGIVFVQGRSYGSRYQHHSHAIAAARRGIASILFDGRGVGTSGGERGRHTLQNRLDDAEAALAALRNHPDVDAERVGLFGHSAGGWVIPVVAQRASPVAFLVMHAGPAGTLADQQAQVVREMTRRSGDFSEEDLERAYAYQHSLVELLTSGAAWPDIEAHVRTADDQAWAVRVDRPTNETDDELDYFRRNPHNNTAALRATTMPVLAVYGGDDYIVPPRDNEPALEALLRAAGNEDFRIVTFPGADHGLMLKAQGRDGSPFRWERRPPGYFDTILDWLGARVAG